MFLTGKKEVFSGRLLRLVKLENKYECVEHPGAVAILPVLSGDKVVLIRQIRPAVGREIWEIPAGLLEPGEEPLETGRRELLEETGYTCSDLREIHKFFTSPGFSDEQITLFVASGLKKERAPVEDSITVEILERDEVKRKLEKGFFTDAKTILALQYLLFRKDK